MAFSAGELVAVLKLDDAQFNQAINAAPAKAKSAGSATEHAMGGAQKAADQAAVSATGLGAAVERSGQKASGAAKLFGAMAGVFAGAKLVQYVGDSIKASSDLNETISKSNQIFGAGAKDIQDWGQNAAKSMGLSRAAAIDSATSFGNMFTQLGFTSKAAADLSKSTVQMAVDLGSFNNLPTADVIDKISGAFRGEYDSLQQVIPNISAARVQQEAMAETGKTSAAALTAQEKATAVLTIVQRDGAKAMGDFARTSGGFANQSKITQAAIEDQKAALGDKLMPVVQTLMQLFSDVGVPIIGAFGDALAAIGTVAGPVIKVLGDVVKWAIGLPAPIQVAVAAFTAFSLLRGPLSSLAGSFDALKAKGVGALTALKGAVIGNPIGLAFTVLAAAVSAFSSANEGAKASASDFSDAIDAQTGKLKANSQELIANNLANTKDENGKSALEKALALGVATDTYTKAVMGNADAIKIVNDAIAAGLAPQQQQADAVNAANQGMTEGVAVYSQYTDKTKDAQSLQTQFAANTGALTGKMNDAKNAIAGAGGATDDKKASDKDAIGPAKDLSGAVQAEDQAHKDLATSVRNAIQALDEMQHRNDPKSAMDAAQHTRDYAAALRDTEKASRDIGAAQDAEKQAQIDLTAARDKATSKNYTAEQKALDVAAAERGLADAHAGVQDALDRLAKSQDTVYTSGEDLKNSFIGQAQEAYNAAVQSGNTAGAYDAAKNKTIELTKSLYDQLIQSGLTDAQAKTYISTLGLIPDDVATAISTPGMDSALTGVDLLKKRFDAINGQTATVNVKVTQSVGAYVNTGLDQIISSVFGKKAAGGLPGYAAGGGPGLLPGTPPSDPSADNLIAVGPNGRMLMIRSREFIQPQPAVDYYGVDGMEAIRQRRVPKSVLQGYASGGSPAMAMLSTPMPGLTAPSWSQAGMSGGDTWSLRAEINGLRSAITQMGNRGAEYHIELHHHGQGEYVPEAVVRALKEYERTHV